MPPKAPELDDVALTAAFVAAAFVAEVRVTVELEKGAVAEALVNEAAIATWVAAGAGSTKMVDVTRGRHSDSVCPPRVEAAALAAASVTVMV